MHESAPDSKPPGPRGDRLGKTEQTLEVSVFIFLILPSLLLSFIAVGGSGLSFTLGGVAIIFRDLALVSLVLFFLWRNREALEQIGWSSRCRWQDVAWGVAMFIPLLYAAIGVEQVAQSAGLSPGPKSLPAVLTPHGRGELGLAAIMVAVIALAEETIFRGYLILRFKAVTGSVWAAAILSSFVFSLGHGYEGSAGVITVGFMGLVFALVYLWRKSLVAPIVMHFLQDFLSIVALPALGLR